MTEQQHKTLVFIVDYIKANGFSPSVREIADHIGVKSISNVNRIVTVLARQGLVTCREACARSVRPVNLDVDSYIANGNALFGAEAVRKAVGV